MIDNVFPRGRVVPSDDVLERHGFVRELTERLIQGDSVMLAGPLRTGKTCVATETLRRVRERGYYTLDLDLFHTASLQDFGLRLFEKTVQLRTGIFHSTTQNFKEFTKILGSPDIFVKIQDLELHAKLNPINPSPLELIDIALTTMERIAQKDQRRLIVLIDEFQEVDRLGGTALLKQLRSIMQYQQGVSYLFLGSEPSLMQTLFADRRQAFYRFATLLHLPDIDQEEWREYAQQKFAQASLSIQPAAFHSMIEHTGGHPFCVMAVLSEAYVWAKLTGVHMIDLTLMHQSLVRTYEELEGIYDELWKRILTIPKAGQILEYLVQQRPPYQVGESTQVQRALTALINTSILRKERRGRYTFVEPMFKNWILRRISSPPL
jgi:AAA+ ATPase superfamily predicted ATPase